ncbi:Aste57867_17688 [Aphanomyces stellatus]|uniref:Aste57867_17688 protein n=2 Tax=Aphanomyces stellatus TaxID=120398 RepID=A0A485L8Y9_9STRA|nr:hypothetical protein As57867_017627 [Aphanomyces stellatus]VFT94438.1 Aste57867_17688 [Aphanomyces stellatus]
MREWIMDKRFVAAFLAAQSGPRSGNNDNDPRVQQALAWIQGPIKPPAPATSKPPNHHPSSGPTRSTNHRAIELLAPTTLDPTASLDDLCRYIHSSLTTTTWHIMGHFYLDSSDDGPQLAVFPASHKKQTGKSFVVKLTQCDDELAFADAVDAFQGDKSAFLVDWIDWGPVTLAGVDCFALVMERGQGNCHDQLREIQSDAFLRLRCVDHVTRAVGYLHTNEYVHGDLKLENVVQFGSYKLIDFDNATRMGHTMARRCTKSYCPPELALHLRAGGPPVQASATFDLWCLGVLVLKLFVKNGVLVEFDGLDGDAILDVIAAPGFSFQASLRAADVNGRQRKYLAKCLEPNPAKRATSIHTMLKVVELKANATTTTHLIPHQASCVPCTLPCVWSLSIDHTRRRVPTGDALRLVPCTVRFLAPQSTGCLYAVDGGATATVPADSKAVQLVLPFLRVLRSLVEVVDYLADEGLAVDVLTAFNLAATSFPAWDALDKTVQALESIHSTSVLSLESDLDVWLERMAGPSSSMDEMELQRLHFDVVQAFTKFATAPETHERVADLLNAIGATTQGGSEAVAVVCGLRKGKPAGATDDQWLCATHATTTPVSLLACPKPPHASHHPWPGIWMLDTKQPVPSGWDSHVDRLRTVTFQVRFQCEHHGGCADNATEVDLVGGSDAMQRVLPVLKASAQLLKGLTLASYYELAVGDGFEFDFQHALRHINFVAALEKLHDGVPLPADAALDTMTDRLENEDLEDDQAAEIMDHLRRMFLEHRHSKMLGDAIQTLGLAEEHTPVALNGLYKTTLDDGNVRWVCANHVTIVP